jgi:hypothetical protein
MRLKDLCRHDVVGIAAVHHSDRHYCLARSASGVSICTFVLVKQVN